jgi:hypothetical protein
MAARRSSMGPKVRIGTIAGVILVLAVGLVPVVINVK